MFGALPTSFAAFVVAHRWFHAFVCSHGADGRTLFGEKKKLISDRPRHKKYHQHHMLTDAGRVFSPWNSHVQLFTLSLMYILPNPPPLLPFTPLFLVPSKTFSHRQPSPSWDMVQMGYTAVLPDECSLDVGDALHVSSTLSDGWCVGKNLTKGRIGAFPSVCTSPCRSAIPLALPTDADGVTSSPGSSPARPTAPARPARPGSAGSTGKSKGPPARPPPSASAATASSLERRGSGSGEGPPRPAPPVSVPSVAISASTASGAARIANDLAGWESDDYESLMVRLLGVETLTDVEGE